MKRTTIALAVLASALLSSASDAAEKTPKPKDSSKVTAESASARRKKEGWQTLFNGKDLTGWHNFKSDKVKPGWQVKDGNLVCVDPHNAGDLVTEGQYDWFELEFEFKMAPGA